MHYSGDAITDCAGAFIYEDTAEIWPKFAAHMRGKGLVNMSRYYFDMRQGNEIVSDEEGLELSIIEAVQEEAARSLADMARDAVRAHRDGKRSPMAIEVLDDNGPVLQVEFTFDVERLRH
jgi:hypothetical protein